MQNILTIDVEEAFHAVNLERVVPRPSWAEQPSRVEIGMERLLGAMRETDARATCFVLGVVAERNPGLVRRLAEEGHEIASHGYDHRQVTGLAPGEFEDDLARAERAIFDACGVRVDGYRAPHFSLRRASPWAFEILADRGYRFDSSLFPARHPEYGDPHALLAPHRLDCGGGRMLLELPVAVLPTWWGRVPVAGGGYLRQYPGALFRGLLRRLARRSAAPVTLYCHPWEFDPEQPRVALRGLRRARHYTGLRGAERKLRRVLREFSFGTVSDAIAGLRELPRVSIA